MVTEPSMSHLPSPGLLAQPVTYALVGYTRHPLTIPGRAPDGHIEAGVISYSTNPEANRLFLIDIKDGDSEHYPICGLSKPATHMSGGT
jgi:hypothetical protein